MNFLDIIFLLILSWGAFKGYKRGVFATLSRIAGYIVGLIVTLLFYQPLQIILVRKFHLVQKLSPWVGQKLSLPTSSFQTNITDVAMDKAAGMINQCEMPGPFKEIMVKYVQDFAQLPEAKGINSLGEGISYTISEFIVAALSFAILLIGLTLVFRVFLPRLFKAASPKPVAAMDKLGGGLLGFCGGVFSATVLVIILMPLASLGALKGNPSPLADQVHSSIMVNLLMTKMKLLVDLIF